MRKNRINKICIICGIEYLTRPDRNSKYCNRGCWNKRNPLLLFKCKNCNNEFLKYKTQTKGKSYCSEKCCKEWKKLNLIGANSPAYKDGKSLERDRARLSGEVKIWRIKVFKRDKYTCQICGYKGKEIQAHHKIEWAKDESKRFEIDNGQTVCIDCHGKIHNRNFRRMKETKEANQKFKSIAKSQ